MDWAVHDRKRLQCHRSVILMDTIAVSFTLALDDQA